MSKIVSTWLLNIANHYNFYSFVFWPMKKLIWLVLIVSLLANVCVFLYAYERIDQQETRIQNLQQEVDSLLSTQNITRYEIPNTNLQQDMWLPTELQQTIESLFAEKDTSITQRVSWSTSINGKEISYAFDIKNGDVTGFLSSNDKTHLNQVENDLREFRANIIVTTDTSIEFEAQGDIATQVLLYFWIDIR